MNYHHNMSEFVEFFNEHLRDKVEIEMIYTELRPRLSIVSKHSFPRCPGHKLVIKGTLDRERVEFKLMDDDGVPTTTQMSFPFVEYEQEDVMHSECGCYKHADWAVKEWSSDSPWLSLHFGARVPFYGYNVGSGYFFTGVSSDIFSRDHVIQVTVKL